MDATAEPSVQSLPKRLAFWGVIVATPFLLLELLLRVYFAFQVGYGALLYGFGATGAQHHIDPGGESRKRKDANHTVDNIPNLLESPVMAYTKYSPRQKTVDHDFADNVFDVSINSKGFRGPEFETRKTSGCLRVITLGASSTFGYHDRDNETYPHYLRDTLTTFLVAPGSKYSAVEVINFGIPHHTSSNIEALFMAEAIALEPDVVTFYEGINDAHQAPAPVSVSAKTKSTLKRLPYFEAFVDFLRSHIMTVGLLANINQTYAMRFSAEEVRHHSKGKGAWFIRNVESILAECRRQKILFVVATQQAKSGTIERENIRGVTYAQEVGMIRQKLETSGSVGMQERDLLVHHGIMDTLKNWARHTGVPLVDCIQALDQRRDVLTTWVHLTPEGNRIVASVLGREIARHIGEMNREPAVRYDRRDRFSLKR